jgi:hypothetical protein
MNSSGSLLLSLRIETISDMIVEETGVVEIHFVVASRMMERKRRRIEKRQKRSGLKLLDVVTEAMAMSQI